MGRLLTGMGSFLGRTVYFKRMNFEMCQFYLNNKILGKLLGEETIVRSYVSFFRCDENY